MKKSLFALAAMASLGLFSFGCGDGQDGDACFTALDCDAEQGLVCDTHDATCKKADACYTKKGKFCDQGYTCNPDNGECVVSGSSAENCHTKGDVCDEDGYTCVQDSLGAWACMPDDQECPNGTLWSSIAEDCVSEDLETCEHGLTAECSGEGKTVCDPDLKLCVPRSTSNEPKPYKYIKIDDLTTMSDIAELDSDGKVKRWKSEDPGADIDAIVLTKAGSGEPIYAESVQGYRRGDGDSSTDDRTHAFDSEAILHAPDSMDTYPSDTCKYYLGDPQDAATRKYPFVSLGGENGWIIVEMGGNIEKGDHIDIIELGDCNLSNTQSGTTNKAKAESMKVQVAVGDKTTSTWHVIQDSGAAQKGVLSIDVTIDLPEVADDGTDE